MRKAAGKRKRKSNEGLLQTCPDIAQISLVYIPLAELSHIAKHSSREVGKCRFYSGWPLPVKFRGSFTDKEDNDYWVTTLSFCHKNITLFYLYLYLYLFV